MTKFDPKQSDNLVQNLKIGENNSRFHDFCITINFSASFLRISFVSTKA